MESKENPILQVVIPSEESNPKNTQASVTFSWSNVGFAIPSKSQEKRFILSDNSGSVTSGQVIAIMGGSGAGKSTLLNCLSGRLGPGELTGEILFNGSPRDKTLWKSQCAFVEQDDVMFRNLTVLETLTYAARLRLPSSMTRAQKDAKVNEIIMELGLDGCKNVRIGDSENKGISGGERKRVAIGMELVSDPDILFLDEPTSGLDAFTAVNIISTIKKMALEKNRIVILTIHQPRTDILELFDKILLLSVGNTIWYGSTEKALEHFKKLGFVIPPNTNPSDYFMDIATLDRRSETLKKESMARIKLFQDAWLKKMIESPLPQTPRTREKSSNPSGKVKWPSTWGQELGVLLSRNLIDVSRDAATLRATFGQGVIMALLIGFIFFQVNLGTSGIQNRLGVFFFICVNQTFLNLMPNIIVFPEQRQIVKRERAAGTYRSTSAYLAKVLSTLPACYMGSLILSIPSYWMIGLQKNVVKYFSYIAIVLVQSHTANSFGLMIGAAVPNTKVGLTIAPLFMILMILFGGQFVNLGDITPVLRWLQYLSIIAYSNKALAQNEFGGLLLTCPPDGKVCISGESILNIYGLDSPWLWNNVLINLGFSFAFLTLGYVFFYKTSAPLMRLDTKKVDHKSPALADSEVPMAQKS